MKQWNEPPETRRARSCESSKQLVIFCACGFGLLLLLGAIAAVIKSCA